VHYIIRQRSRNLFAHLLMPALGATVLGFIVVNANVAAQRLGFVWIGFGVLVLLVLYATKRRLTLPGPGAASPLSGAREGLTPWAR
jgi:hypothetical protein